MTVRPMRVRWDFETYGPNARYTHFPPDAKPYREHGEGEVWGTIHVPDRDGGDDLFIIWDGKQFIRMEVEVCKKILESE